MVPVLRRDSCREVCFGGSALGALGPGRNRSGLAGRLLPGRASAPVAGEWPCHRPSRAGDDKGQGTLLDMASDVGLRGVYVAAVTPFEPGGGVARPALE